MKRPLLLSGLVAALLGVCGCGSSKPEVPSWFKSNSGSAKNNSKSGTKLTSDTALNDLSIKVKQLGRKVAALDDAIKNVKESERKTVKQLKAKGVTSSASLKNPEFANDRSVQILKESLDRDLAEEQKYRQLRDEFEVLQLEATKTQERLERQVKLAKEGISEKDLEDIEVAVRKIDARLKDDRPALPVDVIKGDAVLEKLLDEK